MGQVKKVLGIIVSGSGLVLAGCGGSSSPASSTPVTSGPAVSLSASSVVFSSPVGVAAANQVVTLTNTGTAALAVSGITLTTTAAMLGETNTCGTTVAAGASCTLTISFGAASGSGTSTGTVAVADNAANSPQAVSVTATALGSATPGNSPDCSVGTALCVDTFASSNGPQPFELATDPIAVGLFHGYADPSLRVDPNGGTAYLAYSWAKTLSDGTRVVDLHLASSGDKGKTFAEVGPLWQSVKATQTVSTAYSSVNDSSTETVDLLPIAQTGSLAGQTLWVQAHQSYLVAPQGGIYDQLNATNLISMTALLVPAPASAGAALLGLSTAPEARLGAAGTDPSRNITQNLSTFNATTAKCANWGQPTLWYQAPALYLGLECTEFTGSLDGNELAHFLFSTTPAGTDASKWVWTLAGEFATPVQAIKLGTTAAEGNVSYTFFTEPEFVAMKSGQLALILTPGVFNTSQTASQPVIQYGCRVVPVLSMSPTGITLDTDATTGALTVVAKITENDLYTGVNEGPAACTYDPAAVNGIIMGRKYEDDPTYGFLLYPMNTGVTP